MVTHHDSLNLYHSIQKKSKLDFKPAKHAPGHRLPIYMQAMIRSEWIKNQIKYQTVPDKLCYIVQDANHPLQFDIW
jgi:hypothetical protein